MRLRNLKRSETGGAMVELAVIVPVLVLIAIGVMDYARVYFTSVAVANAARAGAEWGAYEMGRVNRSTENQNFAKQDGAEAGVITVTSGSYCECSGAKVSCSTTCGAYGNPRVFVTDTASKTVTMLLRYPGLPATVTVRRAATFRVQ